jgi:hypothetical protein
LIFTIFTIIDSIVRVHGASYLLRLSDFVAMLSHHEAECDIRE